MNPSISFTSRLKLSFYFSLLLVFGFTQKSIAQQKCSELFTEVNSPKLAPLLEAGTIPFSFKELYIAELGELQSITPEARPQIQSFFNSLGAKKIFVGSSAYRMMNNFLFIRLTKEILEDGKGSHLLFRDSELKNEIFSEIESGRTVLFTHGFNGFAGAAFQDMAPIFKTNPEFKDIDPSKSVLIVTTKSIRSTVAHELQHARDYEQKVLVPIKSLVSQLFKEGQLSARGGRGINNFFAEIRAYNIESKWIEYNTRDKEFMVESSTVQNDFSDIVSEIRGVKFKELRLSEIKNKADWYYGDLLKALKEPTLSAKNKEVILQLLEKILISDGLITIGNVRADLEKT